MSAHFTVLSLVPRNARSHFQTVTQKSHDSVETLHLLQSLAVDSCSTETSKHRLNPTAALLGAAGDLSDVSGTQFSCLCNGNEPEQFEGFHAPPHETAKTKERSARLCQRNSFYPVALTTFPNKRKDVMEEPVIVIHHLKPVLKEIKGKEQNPVCIFWSNTP